MPDENTRPARLLVVDDQPANLKVVGDILGNKGYEILMAGSGQEALDKLDRETVDLILLDVLMPEMDGIETCRRIRANPLLGDLPIIFLSADDDAGVIVLALENGGVDYVIKPFNHAELISRVRTHLALKMARDQLSQLAEDKDELLGILAHDLQNHLGGMCMSAKLLRDRARIQNDERLERLAENVVHSSEQMLAFVKEFLANASAERGLPMQIESLSLYNAATSAIRQYSEAARRKGITLTQDGQANGAVRADSRALDQVLDNLISNALKFSPPGKTVKVVVGHGEDGSGTCRVQDEGPGFTPEDRDRMYKRYSRLSARPTDGEPSTGLGLSIVHKLVKAMNGQLECESQPGQGASFTLRLPPAKPKK